MIYFQSIERFLSLCNQLVLGLYPTLTLYVISLAASLPLGFFVALSSMSRFRAQRRITAFYTLIMRGTPLMLQIIFLYYGLYFVGITLPSVLAAIIAFVINYAAYFGEIFRGGIESISVGQSEAADVLGFTRAQTMRRIILPQVMKTVMPSVGNEVINLVKDTALVAIIAIPDLLQRAKSAVLRDMSIFPFILAGLFYLAMNAIVTWGLKRVEKRFSYYK